MKECENTSTMTNEVLLESGPAATINGYESGRLTVLVASSEATVLMYATVMLRDAGRFNLLMANSGADAIQQAKGFVHPIQVLLADFQMHGMTGIELATELTAERPDIKVLLMSDFPTGTLVLNDGWHFLPKPFVSSQLTALVTTMGEPDKASRFAK